MPILSTIVKFQVQKHPTLVIRGGDDVNSNHTSQPCVTLFLDNYTINLIQGGQGCSQ